VRGGVAPARGRGRVGEAGVAVRHVDPYAAVQQHAAETERPDQGGEDADAADGEPEPHAEKLAREPARRRAHRDRPVGDRPRRRVHPAAERVRDADLPHGQQDH
jgi:hypothetical protein